MNEHYSDDLYTETPDDLDSSYDTTLGEDPGTDAPLWETDPLDASADVSADPTATDPLDVPPAPELPDYTDPLTDPVTGEPADPWVQDQADAAAADPYAVPTDTADDPYAVPSDVADDPYAPVDPNDPNAGLDPSDPSYDHYYAENGHPYEGPSDVSADGSVDPLEVPQGGDVPVPADYDPDAYTPSEYPYEDPFAQPGHDPSYDPYTDPGYNPYADGGPYGGDYDVVYDPCWGDVAYDPYNGVFVQVDVTVEGDVYVVGDQSADVYVVNEGDTYVDNSSTSVDNSSTYVDNSTSAHDHAQPTAATEDNSTYHGGYDADSVVPYPSYGPMDVAHYTPDWAPADFDGVGDPLGDAAYYHGVQDLTNSPLATEGQIIEKLTGQPFNEAALAAEAQNAGFFDPVYGMDGDSVGSLLELHGIETETVYDADMDTLLNALESGDPVMAVVDTNETGLPLHDVVTGTPVEQNPPALSSVWVTGVDVQPDGSVYVLVNDPSWPEGQTMPVEISDFANAWADGGNQAVIAHQPA
ncbi:hypothetical protein LO772_23405 [Yinghuangia sp. ASG 101]|uniref:hypothetical protein n=1 Tax=Yinghuangia sp. ASG 101 TaxID=2896848 RepID=UPI001E54D7B5|nr:hypothetical protein [Yinghuangia sp. ASG 101]UGQ09834.1 hypothetical protein LO772_23405 [Yinghuangia sp. ASG 101]